VLDLEPALVNIDAVRTGELSLDALDDEDAEVVEGLLRRHLDETASPVAAQLLVDLAETRGRFTRVIPAQYVRVRRALAEAAAEGRDIGASGVWDEILTVARG
jgi:glutamate synthase (NADPH/NADH) large chain